MRAFQAAQQPPHEQLPLVRGVCRQSHGQSYGQSHGRLASFTRRRTRHKRGENNILTAEQARSNITFPTPSKPLAFRHRPDSLAQTSTDVIPTAST